MINSIELFFFLEIGEKQPHILFRYVLNVILFKRKKNIVQNKCFVIILK